MARSSLLLWGFSFYFVLVVLVVPIICQTPPGPPVITGPAIIRNGETVTIICSSTGGDPTPTVKWLRNDVIFDESVETSGGVTRNSYTFTASPAEHLAVFECQTDNGVLQNPLTSTLFVIVNTSPQTPTLTGTSNPAPNQQNTWTCTSTGGYPAPTMTMRIGNNQFSTSEFTTNSVAIDGAKSFTVTGTLNWSPTIGNNGQTLFCDVAHPTTLTTPQTVSLPLTVISPLAISATPTFYNPTIGTSVTLNCVVTSGTATSITWLKANSILNINGDARLTNGDVSTPSLSISNVQQSDSGSYVCRAADATGTVVNSNTITVTPQGTPPVVTIAQPTYSQLTGQQITLGCTVSSNNSPLQSVQWTFTNQGGSVTDPVVISTSPPFKYAGSTNNNPSLTINSLASTDQGTYRCRAINLIGTTTSNPTVLTVTGSIPTLQIPQNTYSDTYGNQVTIPCSITSATPSATTVYWTRNQNNNIININNGDSGYQGSTVGSPSLTINFATTGSNGVYTCFAANTVGTGASNPTTLTITGGMLSVDVSPNFANVVQGTSQQITCTVTGTPAATGITWTRLSNNNQLITLDIVNSNGKYTGGTTSNPHLTISNFQSSDAGTYVCRATNAAGSQNSDNSVLTYIQPLTLTISPPSGTATYGDVSYTIQCQISGTTASSWSWTKTPINGGSAQQITQGSKYSIQNSPNNPFLTINNIVEADEADYACQARNVAGSASSSNSRLIVNGATLTVGISPTSANVLQSTNRLVQCLISGQPSANNIQWLRTINSVQTPIDIVNNGGKYSGGTTGNPHITINNFQSSDAGIYVCRVTNAYGTATSPTSTLTYMQSLSITISPPTGTAIIGDNSYQIQCQISGTTASSWSWTKTPINGGSAQPITQGSKYSIQNSPTNPFLTINNIVEADEADYACQATNVAGSASSSNSRLIVNGAILSISISPPSALVIQGTNQQIVCNVQGTPAAQSISWTKNGAPIAIDNSKYTGGNTANPSLTINNFQSSDAGNYVCSATNAAGTSTSGVSSLAYGQYPSIVVAPTTGSADIGTNSYVITCTVTATPVATSWLWTKTPIGGGTAVTINQGTNTNKYEVANNAASPSLTIKNIESSDEANYVCTATNTAGTRSSGNAKLTVTGAVLNVQISPSSAEVLQGDSQTITCTVSGSPQATAITWTRTTTGGPVTLNVQSLPGKYSGGTVANPSLIISNFATSDAGSYICKATNAVGIASSLTSVLTYKAFPNVVVTPATGNAVIGTNSYTITCTVTATPVATSWSWTKTPIGGGTAVTINQGTNTNKYEVANNAASPSLTIKNIESSDEANYVCTATNTAGTRSSSNAQLTVTGGLLNVDISPATANVIQGNSQQIVCTVTGTPPATAITWTRSSNNQLITLNIANSNGKYSDGSVSQPSLTISNFQSSDAGAYVCKATNLVGEASSQSSVLTYIEPISITISPPSGIAIVGDVSYTIQCQISGTTASSWSWTKTPITGGSTQQITQGSKYSIQNSPTNPVLTINNIVEVDEADYACQATNVAGSASSSNSRLIVNGGALSVSVTPATKSAVIGDNSVVIQCTVSGIPRATSWSWTFSPLGSSSQTTIAQGTNNGDYTVSNSNTNPHLTIKTITAADAGDYICRATNVVGTSSSTQSRLTVTGALLTVAISPPTALVIQGNSQTITCSVTGSPIVTGISWTRENNAGLVTLDLTNTGKYTGGNTGNPSLTISNFETTDAGTYVCKATNAVGTASSSNSVLTYAEYLILTASPSSGSAVIGDASYVINCAISGSPTATSWYWVKSPVNGNAISTINRGTNNNKYTMGTNPTNPSLTIKSITQDDNANYRCQATNIAGERASNEARLLVTGGLLSVIVTPTQSSPNFGAASVTIQCSINGSPGATSVGWRKVSLNGQTSNTINAVNSNGKYAIASSTTNPDLTINNINFDDDANYVCFATNLVGSQNSGNARVDVIGSQPQVSIPSTLYSIIYGNDVTIPCNIINSNPAHTIVTWYRVDNNGQLSSINVGDLNQYSGGTLNTPALTIKAADSSDIGAYRCAATNIVGEGQSSNTRLTVVGGIPVVQLSKTTETVLYDGSITIECAITYQVPAATYVFWQHTRNEVTTQILIANSAGKYSGSTVATPSLTINNAVFEDDGQYQCFAQNLVGIGRSVELNLNIAGGLLAVSITMPGNVLLGNQATLFCSVSGTPSATNLYWEKKQNGGSYTPVDVSGNSRYSGGSLLSPNLVITNAAFSDSGTYRCLATNAAGLANSIDGTLNVVGNKPTVTIGAPSYNVDYGSDITLGCTILAIPPYSSVRWTKYVSGGNPVTINLSDTSKYSGSVIGNPSLTIRSADLSDKATYVCTGTNSVGTGTSSGTVLNVVGGLLTVTVGKSSYAVEIGQTVTLDCSWSGIPTAYYITWQKVINGIGRDINVHNGKYVGSTVSSPSLVITAANNDDETDYICTATNAIGRTYSERTSLDVTGSVPQVHILEEKYSVNYGNDITLYCTVNAVPDYTKVKWTKTKGGSVTDINPATPPGKYSGASVTSPSLVINNVNLDDGASYICTATNQIGTGTSSSTVLNVVGGLLTVSVPQDPYDVQDGNSITIPCIVTGNPMATEVRWKKIENGVTEDIDVLSSGGKYAGSSLRTHSLTINNAAKADSAYYQCTATNVEGTSSSQEIFVNVYGDIPSVHIPADTYTVKYGHTITIPCMVSANPTQKVIQWKRIHQGAFQDIDVQQSNGKYSGSLVNSPDLIINDVNLNDETSYICTATNDVGTGQSISRSLDVVGGLLTVSIPSDQYNVEAGHEVVLDCSVSGSPEVTSVLWKKIPLRGSVALAQDINTATGNGYYTGATISNPSLTITATGEADKARYICTATNTIGTAQSQPTTLNVIGSIPTVVILHPPYKVYYGQTVTIHCQVTATPPTDRINWYKTINGTTTTVNTANSKYAGGSVAIPSLTITNANIKYDEGHYVCSATNSIGTGNSEHAFLDVIGGMLTVNVPQDKYSVHQGDSINMICSWSGVPNATSVLWKKYVAGNPTDIIVANSNGKYGGASISSPSLIINSAHQDDEATYLCTATNAEGTSNSQPVKVEVTGGVPVVKLKRPTYVVKHGSYIILECIIASNPKHTRVQWYKIINGNSVSLDLTNSDKYSGSLIDAPSLTIFGATNQDEGNYVCSATNSVGTTRSSQTFLDVRGDAPTVQISSTIFPVLIGNQIILGCNVVANPAATDVYWIFIDLSNQQTTIRQNTNVAKYGGVTLQSPSLVLKSAEFSDEGKYTCYASNSIGTGNSLTADLDVTGKIPTVTIPLTTYSVDFGNQITIGCSVTSNPAHFRVFWRKKRNGITTDLNVANSNGKYSGSTTNNPSLVINNAALGDQASYVCYAENSVGTGSSTTTALSVTGNIPNVNILNTQYNVDYGNTVTLECTVTANPGHTSVYWQKIKSGVTSTIDASTVANDSRLSGSAVNTPSLTITNVNLNDVASYICFAQNSVGIGQSAQTSIVVSGGIPNVVILRNSYGVQVGSVVTLQCVVTADPAHTVVKWERLVNGQLQDVTNVGAVGSGSRLTGSQVDTPSLTINQVTFQDEGNYICTATNAVGTGKSPQTFLGVSGTAPVVTVPNNEYQGNFGQGTTMVCTVTANPTYTRVYWKKLENGVLSDVDMTSSKFSGSSVGQPSLTISNLNKNDQAFYQCYAENSVGTGKSQQTFLRVIGDIPTVQITSSSYSVTLGQNAVLGCTVTANPTEVSVFWRKFNSQNQLVDIDMTTNNNNKYQGSVVGTPSLTIIGTTSDDAGRYVCYAVNAVGTGSSGITTLNIDGAIPIVNIPQDTYSVNIGNQVTLACTVSATPGENNVYWTKKIGNGAETTITKSDATKYQGQTVQSPGLIILNTDFNDIATYICYATNAVGTGKSNPTNLQVIGSLPNVQIPQPSYSANYDQTATIPCTVIATPGITNVQWIKLVNGQEQNIDMTQAKYSGATTNNPSLTIANANLNDEAVYICTATNSVGTGRSQQSYLDVIGAIPVVAVGSNSYSVVKNQNKDLVCTIVATPAATNVQWYRYVNGVKTGLRNVVGKYNTPTVNSPNLRIFNADDQDRGYYLCTASNVVGTGTSQTTFLDVTGNIPIVTVAPLTYNGNIGGSVTIGCQVVANPAATSVYWIKSKNSQDTTISSTTSKYSFSTNNPSLTINNLSSDDEATYVCYATNSIGTGNSQAASLNIIGNIPQVTIPEQSYNSNIGSSVTLVCTVVANPTHNSVYWRRIETNGQVTDIAINNSKYQGATVANPSLTITNVQLADRLNYICFATNSVGTGQSSQTYLNVIGNPPVPTIGETTYSVPFGGSVEMGCTISSNPAHSVVFWKRIQNGVETLIDASYIANNQNKYGGGSLGTPSLTVKSADRNADQAFYECSATNAIGTGRSSRTFLTVTGDIPNVNIPENYYAVEISNNVVIPCNINSNPAHFSVTWQRRNNNGAISNLDVSDQTQYNNGNIGTPALTILNAQNADEGYYICTAANAVGTGSSSLTYIDVTGSILQVNVPQTSYNANYGQTIQLICSVTGTPAANDVYWIKIRNGVSTTIRQSTMDTNKYSGVTLGNPSLTIINANEADSAVYKCYGTNIVGTAESQQTQLIVIGSKPTVNVGPDKSVNLGNSVTLQCVVIATPSATSVQWNKITNGVSNRINVAANPTKYAGASTNTPSLTIYTAANSDQSSYTCQATNAAGTTVSSQTFLTVVGNLPIVTVTPDQQSITVGNPVTLGCSVQANPMHTTVVWKKMVNGVATDLPANSRYSGSTVSNPSLSITSVQSGDNGNYVCYATNSVGTGQSTQTSLNVVGSVPVVNVGSTTYSTNVGNRITLQCTVIANPPHTSVGWQRVLSNGNTQPIDMTNSRYLGVTLGSPSLIIDNTIKADEGNYVCIAANLVGSGQSPQTYLTVVGSTPTVTVPDPTYSVNRGSAITLECSFSANPPATQVRWRKNNVDLGDTAGNAKYGGSTTSSPSLIIYNAAESDEGSYQCTVTNSVGTGISTTTTLDVVGNIPVVSVATNTYNVNLGETVTLQCSVTADPLHTSVYWQKVTGGSTSTIIINNSKYEGSTVSNPSLTIKNAVSGDAGTYYCYATNSVGTGGSTQVVIGVTGNKPSVSLPRSANTANYGETVTIQCEVVANPAATSVYWQKLTTGNNAVTIDTSNTAKYGGATVASPSLIIRNLDSSDIANYICFAANSVGTGQSGQGSLNVIGSNPTVTMVKTAYTQNTGKNIVIGCTVTSSPAHTSVSWTRKIGNNAAETITATGGTKYSISSNINAPSLTIYNIQESDEGVYTCFATNVVGTGQSNPPARLNVIGNMPVVTASIPTTATRLGNPVTITCTVSANPVATRIFWQIINPGTNQGVNIDTSIAKYSGGNLAIPSLTINPVEESDEGNYQCLAENAIGTTKSNQVYLDTIGDPPTSVTVTPSPIVVEEGNMITATCTATGNPQPTFRWFRSTDLINPIDNDAVLNVLNAKESDKGSYVCRASNKFGTNDAIVTADVQFRPKVVIPDLTISGKKGLTAEIRCTQTSNPLATTLTWTKIVSNNAISTIAIDNNKYFGGNVLSPTLTITNLDASDEASYRCSATNAVGTGSSEIAVLTVDLSSPPIGINIYPNGITVLEGKDFSMYCNATGFPIPQYQWFHDDVMIREGQTYSISVSEYNAHDGLYTCKAYNSAGYLQKSIDVDVKYPPISNIKDKTFAPALNNPVTLQCDTLANPSAVQWHWYYGNLRLTDVPDNQKDYVLDMNNVNDYGEYNCVAFNEVGQSSKLTFTVTLDTPVTTVAVTTVTAVTTTQVTEPDTGETVSSAGLSGGEIAAICLGVLFFILLLIALIVCCILQGCCACCAVAAGKDKERRITPDHEKLDIPRFYEVPTVVTREPSLISKRDVSLHMAPMYRPQNDYEINKYRVLRPDDNVDDRYVTSASRPYYLPAIEYTYDEEERRRRHRKKKKSRHHHDDLQRNEQIVLEERVVAGNDVYRTSGRSRVDDEVVTGPEFYFEAE